jgi:tetratricopeptide (TPR) repeat protein
VAVSEAPYDAAVLREAARLSLLNGDFEGAEDWAARAVERAPWDYRGWVLVARQARLLGTTEDVRRGWAEAFAREAPQPLLREAYQAIPAAAVWHDVLRELDPGWMAALGRVADRAGESEAAVQAFEQAAERDPARYADFAPHGAALLSAGEPDAARALVTAALEARPSDAGTQRTASEVFAELGELEQSLAALERAAELNPIHRVMLVRRLAEHEGLEAAVVRVEGWALSSRRSSAVDLELARQALASEARGLCQRLAGRWFEDPLDGTAARAIAERCAR